MQEYTPSTHDIEWTRRLINSLKTGGTWGIPECGVVLEKVDDCHMKHVSSSDLFYDEPQEEMLKRIDMNLKELGGGLIRKQ